MNDYWCQVARGWGISTVQGHNFTYRVVGLSDLWALYWKIAASGCMRHEDHDHSEVNTLEHGCLGTRYSTHLLPFSSSLSLRYSLSSLGLLKFKKNRDMDGFMPDLTDETSVSEVVYQVTVTTSPGLGRFEASLTYSIKLDTFSVKVRLSLTFIYWRVQSVSYTSMVHFFF